MGEVADFTERKAAITYEEVASTLEQSMRDSCAEALEVLSMTDVVGILSNLKFEIQVSYILTIEE